MIGTTHTRMHTHAHHIDALSPIFNVQAIFVTIAIKIRANLCRNDDRMFTAWDSFISISL